MLYKNLKDNQLFRADLRNSCILYKVGDILYIEQDLEYPENDGTEAEFIYGEEDIVYPVKATKLYEQERVMLSEVEDGDKFVFDNHTYMLVQKFDDDIYNAYSYLGARLKEFRIDVEVTPFATNDTEENKEK